LIITGLCVVEAWTAPQTGKRGAQPVYADIAVRRESSMVQ
jgi:hypothetical protein